MILNFSEPTNRPVLETAVDLNNAIIMDHDDITMSHGRGVWSPDGEALTITDMDLDSWKAAVAAISAGTLHITLRKKLLVGGGGFLIGRQQPGGVDDESPPGQLEEVGNESPSGQVQGVNSGPPSGDLEGKLTMRVASPGRFEVRLYVGEELHSTSTGFVDVELCPEQVVVADANIISDSDSSVGPESVLATLPRAFFSVEGVLAMPGDRWLKVGSKDDVR